MYPPAVFQNVRLKQRLFIEGEQLLALRLLFLLLAPGLTRRRTFRRRLFAPGTWFDHLHGSFTLRSIPSGIVRQLLRGRLLPGTNRERRYFGRLSSPIFRDNHPVLRTLLEFGPHLFEQGPDTLKTFEQLRIARNGSFILFQTTGSSVEVIPRSLTR